MAPSPDPSRGLGMIGEAVVGVGMMGVSGGLRLRFLAGHRNGKGREGVGGSV